MDNAEGTGVVYLKLTGGALRARAENVSPAQPPVLTQVSFEAPLEQPMPSASQAELASRISLHINALKVRIQELNAEVKARSTPTPGISPDNVKARIQDLNQEIARLDLQIAARTVNEQSHIPATTPVSDLEIAARMVNAEARIPATIPVPVPVSNPPTSPMPQLLSAEMPAESKASSVDQQEINRLITRCLSELKKDE